MTPENWTWFAEQAVPVLARFPEDARQHALACIPEVIERQPPGTSLRFVMAAIKLKARHYVTHEAKRGFANRKAPVLLSMDDEGDPEGFALAELVEGDASPEDWLIAEETVTAAIRAADAAKPAPRPPTARQRADARRKRNRERMRASRAAADYARFHAPVTG